MAKKQSAPQKTVIKKRLLKKSPLKKPLKVSAPKVRARVALLNTEFVTPEAFLKVGAKAPTFKLFNDREEPVSLSLFKGKRVILYFYPKDDTPGCTQESCDFRDGFAALLKLDVIVLGISRDPVAAHQKFKSKFNLPFNLLSDPDGQACEAYGVWKEKSMYGRKYMGIERSTFIIGANGRIEKIYPKVSVKGHVNQIMEDLK
ncbi:MAG: thioredoxin-dependent thiol peroxidase [Bdellovibrionales bacterium]|nr:thioredoxin-dependent thiol peroxidase [Oligoflexia bacterium]